MNRSYVLAALVAFGCDVSLEPVDAGTDAGSITLDASEPVVASPTAPARVAWACPEGWQEITLGDAQGCEPWPSDWEGCPDGEARFVGDAACAPFESDCPAGEWADDLPLSGVLYVRAGATGGDGTTSLPFGRIEDAVAAASDGDVIAIGRGTYDEMFRVPRAVTLRGICPAETQIRSVTDVDGIAASIVVDADGVLIERLTVGEALFGIDSRGAEVTIRSSVISDVDIFGVVSTDGAVVTLEDVIVRRVTGGSSGSAVVGNLGSTLDLRRVILEDSAQTGALVFDEGTQLSLRDVAIRRIDSSPTDGVLGNGIVGGRRSHVVLDRVIVEHTRAGGVFFNERSTGEIRDLVLRDTLPASATANSGAGLSVVGSSDLVLERAFIADNIGAGIVVLESGSTVTATDVVITGTLASPEFPFESAGVVAQMGGGVELERGHLEDNDFGGLVANMSSTLTLRDVTVRNIRSNVIGGGGRALNVTLSSTATVDRMEVSDGAESAIFVSHPDALVTMRDLRVERTASRSIDGVSGRGLTVIDGARAEIERALFRESHEVGVLVFGAGSSAALTDVAVESTRVADCLADDRCAGGGGGSGFAVVSEADLSLTRFISRDSDLAGVQVAREATLFVDTGIVEDNVIGANVQEVSFDLNVLRNGVIYRRNGVNLDSTELALPEPTL